MTNKEKYDQVFMEAFSLNESKLKENVEYNKIDGWDSIGHMQMVSALEEAFNITMETDDIINFSSYNKGIEILAKYSVNFSS